MSLADYKKEREKRKLSLQKAIDSESQEKNFKDDRFWQPKLDPKTKTANVLH